MSPLLPRCQHIVFCTDFSDGARVAFGFAVDAAARRPGSVLHLLHVVHEPDAQFWRSYLSEVDQVEEQASQAIQDKIKADYLAHIPSEVEVKVEVRTGAMADEILDYAAKHSAGLIVMGRQGHGGVRKTLFGNVTEKVVRKANCAVLVVPVECAQIPPNETPAV